MNIQNKHYHISIKNKYPTPTLKHITLFYSLYPTNSKYAATRQLTFRCTSLPLLINCSLVNGFSFGFNILNPYIYCLKFLLRSSSSWM